MTPQFRACTEPRYQAVIKFLLIAALTLNAQAQGPKSKPRTVTLKRGQVLELSLLTPLDSRESDVGDQILFGVTRPLIADGVAALPAPWIVRTPVTYVARAEKKCSPGYVAWTLQTVETPGGQKIKVQPISRDLAKPHGRLVQEVVLDTARNKRAPTPQPKTKKWAKLPLQIAGLPLLPVIAIGMQIDENRSCSSGAIPAGWHFYLAVSEDMQVVGH